MIASSSPERNPIETIFTRPEPTTRSCGTIFLSPNLRVGLRHRACAALEKPQMSASNMPTAAPSRASATARLTLTEDFPTPPLPETMPSTRVLMGKSMAKARSWAARRARSIRALRSPWSIAPITISTRVIPGARSAVVETSCRSWSRSGQAAVVSAIEIVATPSVTVTSRTIPSETMSDPSSGSTTARRAFQTASVPGAWAVNSEVSRSSALGATPLGSVVGVSVSFPCSPAVST